MGKLFNMNVRQLKELIKDVPDEMQVLYSDDDFQLTALDVNSCGVFEIQDPADEIDEYTKVKALILTLQDYNKWHKKDQRY